MIYSKDVRIVFRVTEDVIEVIAVMGKLLLRCRKDVSLGL